MSEITVSEHWREKLGIKIGMTKEEALECFMEWRTDKKTCERCDGTEYVSFCPVHLICEEAERVGVNIATSENTPVFLPSTPILTTSIRVLSTM